MTTNFLHKNAGMRIKKWKSAIVQKIFSYGASKCIWYKFVKIFLSRKPRLIDPVAPPRILVWGDAIYQGDLPLPKIIWTYWSGAKSACAEACQKSWGIYKGDFDIKKLNESSVKKYLPDLPDVPAGVPVQLVSDLIRLMLLEKYGGIWMDFSTLITRPLDWVVDVLSEKHECFVFYNEFPDEYRSDIKAPIIENGFIAARPGSRFIANWRKEFESCVLSEDYKTYFRNQIEFDELVANFIGHDQNLIDYLACYLAAQKVMRESRDYSVLMMNAEDEYYYYYYKTIPPRHRRKFAEEVLLKDHSDFSSSRVVKINGGHRYMIDQHIGYGCFRGQSLLGQYL